VSEPGLRQGIPFVVSGPSGVGKTSIERRVVESDPDLEFSVSHTTRAPRPGERDGEDYWFVAEAEFRRLVEEGSFLEWAEYQQQLYGTSRAAVTGPTGRGVDLILEVEVQGARQLRERLPGAIFAFVLPPSMEQLEARLRGRRSDSSEAIAKRLARAEEEVREVVRYDYVIINEDLDRAVAELAAIVAAARLERDRVLPGLRKRFDLR
jgi:guanylate kinase